MEQKAKFEELTLEAEQIVESITDFELKELAYQTLTTFYEKKEVYKKAFEYQRKLNELKINRYQQDKEAAISKIQVQFDTEQKERKINFQRLQLEKQELELVQKDQIEELNRTLEKKVKQRTLELERQNKELQQFAFIIAHDLKEPARKIGSFVNLLLRQHQSKFDPKSLELFDFILSNTKRINVQLEDLIGYTSLDTWDEKNKQTVDVERLVYDVLKDLTRMVEESQANIVVNVELENVMVNEKHLYALLKHLIQNSLKFARKDCENKVEITAQKIPGNYLFAVKDSGIGIEVEYQQRIFEIFKRLDQSHSGTGIGLAMCKKIVQLYKGKIWVDSEQGEGSTFFFTIPI